MITLLVSIIEGISYFGFGNSISAKVYYLAIGLDLYVIQSNVGTLHNLFKLAPSSKSQ